MTTVIMGRVGQPYVTRGAVTICYCHRRLMEARLENSGDSDYLATLWLHSGLGWGVGGAPLASTALQSECIRALHSCFWTSEKEKKRQWFKNYWNEAIMQWQQEFPTIVRRDSLTDNLAEARQVRGATPPLSWGWILSASFQASLIFYLLLWSHYASVT